MNMDCFTAIIPVKIDSPERLKNLQTTVSFLLKFFNCNIIVKEVDVEQKVYLEKNPKLLYFYEKTDQTSYFHRTKILNDMLSLVQTKYTINYDCDILVPQKNMLDVLKMLDDGYDVVFPYAKGTFLTCWNLNEEHLNKILNDNDTSWLSYLLKKYPVITNYSGLDVFAKLNLGKIITTGGIQCFNTESYKAGFGENEDFIDWGPEDQERIYRFFLLGYKIGWVESGSVLHMDHPKSPATDTNNTFNIKNLKLWNFIVENIRTQKQMLEYMKSLKYTKRFTK
jgi:hypothetical protein